jgi:membrane-associated protease RseP (regulator of RpoE activity)
MKHKLFVSLVLITMCGSIPLVHAGKVGDFFPVTGQSIQRTQLGITLVPVPYALSVQLGSLISEGQGVMLQSVAKNSPADRAGLQVFDIIISANGQKIYSPAQFAGLVRATRENNSLQLEIVHQGKLKTVAVAPELVDIPDYAQRRYPVWPMLEHSYRPPMAEFFRNQQRALSSQDWAWDSFESVQVKTLPEGRYHAEISYKDKEGVVKEFTFEGEREEIFEQIKQRDELPQDKQQALLNVLNTEPESMFDSPKFNDAFFNTPFWYREFGRDHFFNRGFSTNTGRN